jgi:hypothetical protein
MSGGHYRSTRFDDDAVTGSMATTDITTTTPALPTADAGAVSAES